MARLAIVDRDLPHQIRTNPDALRGLDLAWIGTDVDALLRVAADLRVDALIVHVELLGDGAVAALRALRAALHPQLTLVLHTFASRRTADAFEGGGVYALRAPVALATLRSHLTAVIIRGVLDGAERRTAEAAAPAARAEDVATGDAGARASGRRAGDDGVGGRRGAVTAALPASAPPASPRMFTDAQLATLLEVSSSVQCECPNHVAELVHALVAFERYAAACSHRSPADAAIHRRLHADAEHCRSRMEAALRAVVEFEQIAI
jgi:hypothetical protein